MLTTTTGKDVYFDVDDTLVMWGKPQHPRATPFLKDNGEIEMLVPNVAHIEALIRAHFVGHTTIVWSGNGKEWAKRVIEMMGLEHYVTFVHNKPDHFYDDMPAAQFMKNRIYYEWTD